MPPGEQCRSACCTLCPALRGCEQITFNAETAEAAEKKCLRISLRALRALRSNVAFFHRLFRGLPPRPMRIPLDTCQALMTLPWPLGCHEKCVKVARGLCGTPVWLAIRF